MEEDKLYTARIQVVESMEQRRHWREAAKLAGLQISQAADYQLHQRVRQGGEQALHEGRHGHPSKLRGEARTFLEETCRQAPHTPSHAIQTQLAEQFTLTVSVSQINRVRATLGVSNPPQTAKKLNKPTTKQEWQEGVGGLLLLAAAQADQALTQALARWTAAVWQVEETSRSASSPCFYVDGHRKPVYTETLFPRRLIGRLGKIAGCRALALLHDEQGHPLLVTTHRGDLHLTQGVPQVLTSFLCSLFLSCRVVCYATRRWSRWNYGLLTTVNLTVICSPTANG